MAGAIKPKRKNVSEQNAKKDDARLEEINKEIKNNDKVNLPLNLIFPPTYHDRKFINRHSIVELSDSIKSRGLIYPIVVRKLGKDKYERIIGFRRLEAYKILKKETIPTIILENVSDEDALLLMTTENIQREDLSVYDETLALLDYLGVSLKIDQKETIKLLNRYKNFNSGAIELTQEEKLNFEKVEEILSKTGKITINTLVNRLTMLNVHPLLKEELSRGELSFSNAQILNKLNDEEVLKAAIKEVLYQGYSKRETSAYINSLLPKKQVKADSNMKKISKIKLDTLDEEKKGRVNDLIKQILALVEEG